MVSLEESNGLDSTQETKKKNENNTNDFTSSFILNLKKFKRKKTRNLHLNLRCVILDCFSFHLIKLFTQLDNTIEQFHRFIRR